MVVLKEMKDMFWALTLESGKRYSQTVEKAFHLSMAALEDSNKKNDGMVAVMVSKDKADFLLCSLRHKNIFNQTLDLNFTEGEEVTFFINGQGTVHLTGYQLEDERDDFDGFDMSGEEEEDSEDEAPELVPVKGSKRKSALMDKNAKKMKTTKFEDLSDEDDDDEEDEDFESSFLDDEALEFDSDDEEMEMEDSEEEEEEEQEVKPQKKAAKKENQQKSAPTTPSVQESGDASEPAKKKKKKKKNKKKNQESPEKSEQQQQTPGQKEAKTPKNEPKTPKDQTKTPKDQTKTPKEQTKTPKGATQTPKKQVLPGGIVMEDHNLGNGPAAQKGKMVHVYYVGKLQKDGKQFDSCSSGKPFKFRLGAREVISGWDKGLEGMKVGGKRRLIIPPKEGYGNQKQGPIPANSTLIFDVELKSVT